MIMGVERLMAGEDGRGVWVEEVETFDLETDFSMDETRLNYEICRMGQLLVRYGTVAAEQEANLKRKEEKVKLVQAQLAGAIRSQAEKDGRKLTEPQLKEEVINSQLYQDILNELHVLRADQAKTDHWWRAMSTKASLLNALAYKHNVEMKKGLD